LETRRRALQSGGTSSEAIYSRVAQVIAAHATEAQVLIDVGCGRGELFGFVGDRCKRYIGVDVVRYGELPATVEFVPADLNVEAISLPDGSADVVVAVETIEHLENPRQFMRELTRLARSGGWVVVTTPNQLSLLSIATLAVRKQFSAFQDLNYPAHLTALLEVDLLRIAAECSLAEARVDYTLQGRIIGTRCSFPRSISRLAPRLLSDNIIVTARKP
jgi:SAM-dependent methyltransferase